MRFYEREFSSTFEEMSKVLDEAILALRERELIAEENEPCTRLCLEEALVNAVRHGNNLDASRLVKLEMAEEDGHCHIRVSDEGEGFQADEIELPEADQLGGRGICLIRHFMDHVEFCQSEGCLKMRFRRKAVV